MTSKPYSKIALKAAILFVAFLQCSCSDFFEPVESTGAPTEYEFNYWLLQKQYLFEEELSKLAPEGDSVQTLYANLSDPFTRYYPPPTSENASISLNTSIVQGDVGMEYYLGDTEYPLYVYRVYSNSPAGRAGIPRYGNITQINNVKLTGSNAYDIYDSVLSRNKEISLTITYKQDTLHFDLTKEDVYAPTVLLDTLFGYEFINIREFKQTTADKIYGTYGELSNLLDTLMKRDAPRILDLRNNPGGHVSQCISVADLFVKSGNLSTRSWRSLQADGKSKKETKTVVAVPGDPGEGKPFILLVNKGSASCAEIFSAAVSEGAGIPVVGTYTYGKGIGQSTWNTVGKGLAVITNLEFLTPKGNSYHKTGIKPDYTCDADQVTNKCAVDVLQKLYGTGTLSKKSGHLQENNPKIIRRHQPAGGAIVTF